MLFQVRMTTKLEGRIQMKANSQVIQQRAQMCTSLQSITNTHICVPTKLLTFAINAN